MRILHINKYVHERDGVGRYMHDVMRLAAAHGHVCAVLAMEHPKNIPSPWQDFFVEHLATDRVGKGWNALRQLARALWSISAYKKTRAIIAAFKPDVIHAHNLYTHLSPSVLFAAKRAGVPVVLTAHDYGYISANYGLFDGKAPISPASSLYKIAKTRWIKGSFFATLMGEGVLRVQKAFGMWTYGVSCILTASEHVRSMLVAGGYASAHIRVVPLPSGTFAAAGTAFFEQDIRVERIPRMLFAGRFEEYKGIDIVVSLAKRMPDVAFVCVGHGTAEDVLRLHAASLKNLSVLSVREPRELWEMMRVSCGVLVPSRWAEPFGLVALEALCMGTPALVSSLGGLQEIVEHGISGYVLNPQDDAAWEKHIRALVVRAGEQPTSAQRRMYAQARARGFLVGDPERHWEALFAAYTEAIAQK